MAAAQQPDESFCTLCQTDLHPVIIRVCAASWACKHHTAAFSHVTCTLYRQRRDGGTDKCDVLHSVCPYCQLRKKWRGGGLCFSSGRLPVARDHVCCERGRDFLAPGSGSSSALWQSAPWSHPLRESNRGPVSHAFTVSVARRKKKKTQTVHTLSANCIFNYRHWLTRA